MGNFNKIKQIQTIFLPKGLIEFNIFRRILKIIDQKVTKRYCKLEKTIWFRNSDEQRRQL